MDMEVAPDAVLSIGGRSNDVVMSSVDMQIQGFLEGLNSVAMSDGAELNLTAPRTFPSSDRELTLKNLSISNSTFTVQGFGQFYLTTSEISLVNASTIELDEQTSVFLSFDSLRVTESSKLLISQTEDIQVFGERLEVEDQGVTLLESNVANLTVGEDISLKQNASIYLASHTSMMAQKLFMHTNTRMHGIGRGYSGCKGPGSALSVGSNGAKTGGSHGGVGSFRDIGNSMGQMLTYGEVFYPDGLGSGGCDEDLTGGLSGGGALHLKVDDSCELHGSIDLSGADGGSLASSNRYVCNRSLPY
jgi:hypothetical protein